MSEQELMLLQVGQVIERIARPHRCDESIPVELQSNLLQLGFSCDGGTSREALITSLWARKRSLLLDVNRFWSGPTSTPPAA